MLHASVSDRKQTSSPPIANAAKRFLPPVPAFANQSRLRMLQRKPDCECGGKCADCQKRAPQYIGDVDDGIPRLSPDDPSHRLRGGTLPYREATELAKCIRIMGEESRDYCRETVLGEKTVREKSCGDICDRAY